MFRVFLEIFKFWPRGKHSFHFSGAFSRFPSVSFLCLFWRFPPPQTTVHIWSPLIPASDVRFNIYFWLIWMQNLVCFCFVSTSTAINSFGVRLRVIVSFTATLEAFALFSRCHGNCCAVITAGLYRYTEARQPVVGFLLKAEVCVIVRNSTGENRPTWKRFFIQSSICQMFIVCVAAIVFWWKPPSCLLFTWS